jgi:hypothetical protein
MAMNTLTQTYKGFQIRASAQPVQGGFIPTASVRRLVAPETEIDVRPPSVTFKTEDAAVDDAIDWSRDLVDALERDTLSGSLH